MNRWRHGIKVAVVDLTKEQGSPRGRDWSLEALSSTGLHLSVPLPGACAMWSDTHEHKKKEASYPYSSIKNGRGGIVRRKVLVLS